MSIRYCARNEWGEEVALVTHAIDLHQLEVMDRYILGRGVMYFSVDSRTVALDLARALTELAGELPDDTARTAHNPEDDGG